MGSIQIDGTFWLTRPPRGPARDRRTLARKGWTALAARIGGFAAVAFAASLTTLVLSDPRSPALVGPAVASVDPRPKEAARIGAWPAAGSAARAESAPPPSLFPVVIPVLAGSVAGILPPAFANTSSAGETWAGETWIEETFAVDAVIDGRTFRSGPRTVRLADLALPGVDEACRRLDGVSEPCSRRAATQLELTTRWRPLACRVRAGSANVYEGTCRIGDDDLGERLVRTGYVRRPVPDRVVTAAP